MMPTPPVRKPASRPALLTAEAAPSAPAESREVGRATGDLPVRRGPGTKSGEVDDLDTAERCDWGQGGRPGLDLRAGGGFRVRNRTKFMKFTMFAGCVKSTGWHPRT